MCEMWCNRLLCQLPREERPMPGNPAVCLCLHCGEVQPLAAQVESQPCRVCQLHTLVYWEKPGLHYWTDCRMCGRPLHARESRIREAAPPRCIACRGAIESARPFGGGCS